MNKKDFVEYILSLCALHKDNTWHPLMTTCKLVYNSAYVQSCIRMRKAYQCIVEEPGEIEFISKDEPHSYYYGKFTYRRDYGSYVLFMYNRTHGRPTFYVILYDNITCKENVCHNINISRLALLVNIAKNPGVFSKTTSSLGALRKCIIYDKMVYLVTK